MIMLNREHHMPHKYTGAKIKSLLSGESKLLKLSTIYGRFQTGHFLRKIPIYLPIKQVSWLADHSAPRLLTVQ